MKNLTTAALFSLAAGILTSVTILSAYQILIIIPGCYFVYLAFKNKNAALPKSAYWLLAFALTAFISSLINFSIISEPSKSFGRIKYFLFAVSGILVYRIWIKEVSLKLKKSLTSVFLLSICVAGITSLIQVYILKEYRAEGLTGIMRYGYGSGMLLLSLLGAILQHKSFKDWFDVRLGVVAFILGLLGLYLTLTRGGLLGFLCGIPFVLYFYNRKIGLIFGSLTLLGLLTLGSFYFFGPGSSKYSSRFLVNKNVNSDVMRRSQWQAAVYATMEKPLLGWGLSNGHTQTKRIKEQHNLEAQWYSDSHAHNLFLEISAGTGLIGLFIFLGWAFTWVWECFRADPLTRILVVPFWISFMVVSQFEVTFDANNASMIFALYSLSMAVREKNR